MIIKNSDFCKDFDKCVTFYKNYLNHYNSTPRDTRWVSDISYGRSGGSGGKKVEDHYYTKEKYIKLFCEQKGKLNKICKKLASTS